MHYLSGGQTDYLKFYLCITIYFLIRALSDDKSLLLFSDLAALTLEGKKKGFEWPKNSGYMLPLALNNILLWKKYSIKMRKKKQLCFH